MGRGGNGNAGHRMGMAERWLTGRRGPARERCAPRGWRFPGPGRGPGARLWSGSAAAPRRWWRRAKFRRASMRSCGAVPGGRVPVPGQVRLRQRRQWSRQGAGRAARPRRSSACFPHQTRYVVPAAAVTPLPRGPAAARAVLAANMETALNAVWDAAPRPGERIHVVGAGVVGCLVAAGCAAACPAPRSRSPTSRRRGRPWPRRSASPSRHPMHSAPEADLVVHASGNLPGLRTGAGRGRLRGTDRRAELVWRRRGAAALGRGVPQPTAELAELAGRPGGATFMRPRWSHARRMAKALDLLCDPALDQLVTAEVEFAGLPMAMQRLARDPGGALCVRIVYPKPGPEQEKPHVQRRCPRPHHDRPQLSGRGVRPGPEAARRDVHHRLRVPPAERWPRATSWSTSAGPATR